MSGNSSGGGEQWAWLGLLKWTLAHQDGTVPSSESPTMMSEEDKAFLEKVMAEGIVDEGERMKFILEEFSKAMEYYKSTSEEEEEEEKAQEPPPTTPPNEDDLEDLLQELRDIVEQVDYARGFVNLKGCNYLLGAIGAMTASSKPVVPEAIRNICLGIISTLAQNNPPVQKELLELGAIKTLSELFLLEASLTPLSTKTKIMQALSAIVRCYDLTEAVFEQLPQAPVLMVQGLSTDPSVSNTSLRTKTLFFLRAFVGSDTGTPVRAKTFQHAIAAIANTDSEYLNGNSNDDVIAIQLRESALALLRQLLERRLAVTLLLQRKQHLASLGVQRIQKLRSLTGDEAEMTRGELEHWEAFLLQLARAEPEEEPIQS